MNENLNIILFTCEDEMKIMLKQLEKKISMICIDRVTPDLLSDIKINYYNSWVSINNVATISSINSSLNIVPWEKKYLKIIEKSISDSNLDINLLNDGEKLTIIISPPNAEKRVQLIKKIKKICELEKIKIRNIRRNYNEKIKKLIKENKMPMDTEKKYLKIIQDTTDNFIKLIISLYNKKNKDLINI